MGLFTSGVMASNRSGLAVGFFCKITGLLEANMVKCRNYNFIKSVLEPEKYLYCLKSIKLRVALCRFRCGNHKLAKGR